ncbi:MAG: DUF1501 domain-containing protein [Actinomycetota bacterium]
MSADPKSSNSTGCAHPRCAGPDRRSMSRRELLHRAGGGLGGVALAWMLQQEALAAGSALSTHFPPKVKRVIQIYLCGGVSHVDTFDYKPELEKSHGKPLTGKGTVDTFFAQPGNLMKSPWGFQRRGKSGLWVSDLLPHLAGCADDLTVFNTMVAKSNNHTPGMFMMNSGFTMNGFPSMGSWVSYGLGTENQELPAYVVLPDPRQLPAGGAINWTAGFLPANHQGVMFRTQGAPVPDLFPADAMVKGSDEASLRLLGQMNREFNAQNPGESGVAARIRSYELAARMQMSVPEAVQLRDESRQTLDLYGIKEAKEVSFGRNCLLARRLVERGVRFVQLYHGGAFGSPRVNWDAHEDIQENHAKEASTMDKPVAGLLKDLKQRGLLKDTLVIWCTEFGRTPFTQGVGKPGRDHHQLVFSCWMAGGGLKPGIAYGESDEVGYAPGRDPVTTYDFHATILHLLGLDHQRLTHYHNGIQRRLTDVHGEVVKGVLA